MAPVVMYMTPFCPYCILARDLLRRKGVDFTEIDVHAQRERRHEMIARAGGRRTVPQIFIGDVHIGGCDELYALDRNGQLDRYLAGAEASARA